MQKDLIFSFYLCVCQWGLSESHGQLLYSKEDENV